MSCIEPDRNDQGSDVFKHFMNGYRWSLSAKEKLSSSDRHYVPTDILAQTINNLEEVYEALTGKPRPHVQMMKEEERAEA